MSMALDALVSYARWLGLRSREQPMAQAPLDVQRAKISPTQHFSPAFDFRQGSGFEFDETTGFAAMAAPFADLAKQALGHVGGGQL